jgi:transposase InsO family protein
MCRVLEVSRSGYYAWARRAPCARAIKNAVLIGEIRRVHADSDGAYGKRRVTMQLRREGHAVNQKRVERLMRVEGIVGAHVPRRRRREPDGLLGVAGVRAWPGRAQSGVVRGHEADPDRRGRAAPRVGA